MCNMEKIKTPSQQYQVNQFNIENILNWVKSQEMAIPEIQRPFVWDKTKVRNLMDSLYKGFPVGYLIAWRNPKIRMKDGTLSGGKKILIDGQQRVTALTAAVLGQEVVTKTIEMRKYRLHFNQLKSNLKSLIQQFKKMLHGFQIFLQ